MLSNCVYSRCLSCLTTHSKGFWLCITDTCRTLVKKIVWKICERYVKDLWKICGKTLTDSFAWRFASVWGWQEIDHLHFTRRGVGRCHTDSSTLSNFCISWCLESYGSRLLVKYSWQSCGKVVKDSWIFFDRCWQIVSPDDWSMCVCVGGGRGGVHFTGHGVERCQTDSSTLSNFWISQCLDTLC